MTDSTTRPARRSPAALTALLALLALAACGEEVVGPEPPPPPPPATNQAPVVTITAPAAGAQFDEGQAVRFEGQASDPEDGALGGGSLVWTDGGGNLLGTGASFTRSDLDAGSRTVTLTATDSRGRSTSSSVSITVLALPAGPGWRTVGTAFSDPARTLAIGADQSTLLLFLGKSNAANPTIAEARVETWNGSAWVRTGFVTNSGDRHFRAAGADGRGAVVWNDRSLRLGRAYAFQDGSWGGSVISSLLQRSRPAVAFAAGTPHVGYIEQGRLHVGGMGGNPLTSLSGSLGQTADLCVLTADCIRAVALTGTSGAWYAAVTEAAGCVSVYEGKQTGSQSGWLGPCVSYDDGATRPEITLLDGAPVIAFLDRTRTRLGVARFGGTGWTSLGGRLTLDAGADFRLAGAGGVLYLLVIDGQGAGSGLVLLRFDGAWSQVPGPIGAPAGAGQRTVADLAVWAGQPVVALIESGRAVVRVYSPGP